MSGRSSPTKAPPTRKVDAAAPPALRLALEVGDEDLALIINSAPRNLKMLDLDLRKSPLVSVGSPQFAADLTNADGPQGIALQQMDDGDSPVLPVSPRVAPRHPASLNGQLA